MVFCHDGFVTKHCKRHSKLYGHMLDDTAALKRIRDVDFEVPVLCPPGPRTNKERYRWGRRCWDACTDAMKDRVIRNLRRMQLSTKMSGMGCMELILYIIFWECSQVCEDVKLPKIVSACDCALSRVVALSAYRGGFGPEHVFWNIEELLPDELHDEIKQLLPAKGSPPEDCREAYAHVQQVIRTYFKEHEVSGCVLEAPCAVHGMVRLTCQHHVHQQRKSMVDVSDADSEPDEVMMWSAAGVDCCDTTRQGKQKGSAGPSRLGHIVWSALEAFTKPHVLLGECTEDYLPVDLTVDLPPFYGIAKTKIAAKMSGDPYHRVRAMVESHDSDRVAL